MARIRKLNVDDHLSEYLKENVGCRSVNDIIEEIIMSLTTKPVASAPGSFCYLSDVILGHKWILKRKG